MKEEFVLLAMLFGISMTANLGLAIAWIRSARRARRLENELLAPAPPDDRRVDRLEQALEVLTAQLDQLASGQEFLNRVVAERQRLARPVAEPESERTPH